MITLGYKNVTENIRHSEETVAGRWQGIKNLCLIDQLKQMVGFDAKRASWIHSRSYDSYLFADGLIWKRAEKGESLLWHIVSSHLFLFLSTTFVSQISYKKYNVQRQRDVGCFHSRDEFVAVQSRHVTQKQTLDELRERKLNSTLLWVWC